MSFCGAVSDVTMYFPNMIGGFNYVGNPFASAIELQDIQMAANVPFEGAYIDIRDDAEGYVKEYYWYQKITLEGPTKGMAGPDGFEQMVPEGKNGLWIEWVYTYIEPVYDENWEIIDGDYLDFDHYDYPESGTDKQVDFASGEGFLLYLNDETYECFLNAPYEL